MISCHLQAYVCLGWKSVWLSYGDRLGRHCKSRERSCQTTPGGPPVLPFPYTSTHECPGTTPSHAQHVDSGLPSNEHYPHKPLPKGRGWGLLLLWTFKDQFWDHMPIADLICKQLTEFLGCLLFALWCCVFPPPHTHTPSTEFFLKLHSMC